MSARLMFDVVTRNYTEYQKQQNAAELKDATAAHGELLKSIEEQPAKGT